MSRMGIEEPPACASRLVDVSTLGPRALALVPALAFDERGYRLGYGGGFYDAFLAQFLGVAAGLAREATLLGDLGALGALEPQDLPVDLVVTDARSARFPSSRPHRRE